MIDKAISAVIALALAGLALWWFNDRIEAYYQKPLIEAHAKAIKDQADANKKAIDTLQKSKAKTRTIYMDRIKEVEIYAKTLPKDAACLADAEFVRLYNTN